jgi:hypothetical protein
MLNGMLKRELELEDIVDSGVTRDILDEKPKVIICLEGTVTEDSQLL